MDGSRQHGQQLELDLTEAGRGEAPESSGTRVEPVEVKLETESQAETEWLMEEVCERENLERALKKVKSNKGAPGIDGMTVRELRGYLKEHWPAIRDQLLAGTYEPKPVKRVRIAKPTGGTRDLGIPCVVDRFIQQALLQVLQELWDPTFSEHSYGFRPHRSAHQAVARAQQYVAEGYKYVVDIDLEKFFDRVNHDMLMARVARRVSDKRLLRLIRAFLNAGIMDEGLVKPPTDEGVPQGGPLSPLLSNLFLDDLDRELERRGHRFARYADDCNIYVQSERAGLRVMESVKQFLGRRLKLRVNEAKSKVALVNQRKFLGFRLSLPRGSKPPRRQISPPSLERFKKRVRELTRRTLGQSLDQVILDLSVYLRGWRGYYGFCEQLKKLKDLDSWIRRRLRSYIWTQWKTPQRRRKALIQLGLVSWEAASLAASGKGAWEISKTKPIHMVLGNKFFLKHGLISLATK
jgi:RNA-directed DNA polymerase